MNLRQRVLLCTLFYSATAVAQVRVPDTLDLRNAVSAMLAANPQLDAFPLRRESLAGQLESAELKPALQLNAGAENVIGSGDLAGIDGAELTLSLSRVVEMGGKREARSDVASRRIDQLDTEQSILTLDLLAETTLRFIDVAAAQERVTLQEQALALARDTVNLVTPLVTAGQSPALELTRAQASLERAGIALAAAQTAQEAARVRLAGMWGSQDPGFVRTRADLFDVGEAGSLVPLLLSLQDNPDIVLFASEARLREAQLRQARARQESNIQWTAGIRHLREFDDTALVFNVSMPLSSERRAAGAIRSAQAQLAEVDTRRQASLNAMRTQLHSLHLQLGQSIAESTSLRDRVLPLLESVLAQTREAFEGGRYSYVELISARREYLDAQLALINSAANAHRLRAEIERLGGEALPTGSNEE